ncbi:MAG: hypothetical protein BWY39_00493 [Spirochaetes bacterium ADurb.Bin269]|nr:MAG: hypothetical protein BWY39_00493 [Spirochaetes bacterium ADurb.Bin269]HQL31764.1 hypothetical protein [Treponemataceae bacterium]
MRSPVNKLLPALLLLAGISTAVFTADYGLELTNTGGIRHTDEFDWNSDHKATFWLSIPFDTAGRNTLSVEGSAYASKPAFSSDFRFFPDLDLLRLSMTPLSGDGYKISIDAGRIATGDITGLILNQMVDGTEFHFLLPFGNLDLMAGYTGLLNARKGGSLMTTDDQENAATDKLFAFGSYRAIGKITIQFPQLLGPVDLVLEGLGQYDIRRFMESDYTELVDTIYGTVVISMPVSSMAFFNLTGMYQFGVLDSAADDKRYLETSMLASARFDVFPAKGFQFYLQGDYNPANSDFFTGFLPISFAPAGTLFTQGIANLVRIQTGVSFNPLHLLNIDAGAKAFLHSPGGEIKKDLYSGSEATLGMTLKISSDLKFRLDGCIYLPFEQDLQYQASLKAVFAL